MSQKPQSEHHHHHHGHHHTDSARYHQDRMVTLFRANLNQVGIENDFSYITGQSEDSFTGDQIYCPYCETEVSPIKDTNPTIWTHIIAAFLYISMCVPFVFLPYVFNCFGKPINRCPRCDVFLGITAKQAEVLSEDSVPSGNED